VAKTVAQDVVRDRYKARTYFYTYTHPVYNVKANDYVYRTDDVKYSYIPEDELYTWEMNLPDTYEPKKDDPKKTAQTVTYPVQQFLPTTFEAKRNLPDTGEKSQSNLVGLGLIMVCGAISCPVLIVKKRR
jgi:LPXTG-motif cell wall-anchored protein